ncbi:MULTISPECIES: hypothetical protein [Chryseobacterium]|uniref:hypothetical protein n=1 Tax=Chryseobacterium TaxID=59732 RepID=UPI0019584CE8|nr:MULTISPECIES: hypothetical protein [Chryseobacterium]MBM7419753.1 hypothetical protein [Chryseobacterium sp. JUb44]MDH6209686.1 hypothetical protein [Chryseobacterium sp. BIGb0186]WSO08437.1 hypothetical protein VUJ64_11420 [Chryseobacterium scophthalmum]
MKKTIILISLIAFATAYSQVAIGKTILESASSSLEFGNENRGMILPWVTNASSLQNTVNGTLVFDLSDKKVKSFQNNMWVDLSVNTSGIADSSLQDNLNDNSSAKTSIGTPTATAGILVLEDNNKAMILPKVASPHLNIISPDAGMMVYDTVKKQLAVFNGSVWTFWSE